MSEGIANVDLCDLTAEEAIEFLAQELNWKQEHLDPGLDGEWDNYSDRDKEFFRACIKWLLCFPGPINAALSNRLASQQ